MHANEEEKRILGNVHAGEDFRELQKRDTTDGPVGGLGPELIEQFHTITGEMSEILESRNPEVKLPPHIDNSIRFALEALFEARTSRDISTNEFISGLVRNKQLNQALMHLQPVLAIALRPDFPEGQAIYQRLVGEVNQLRASIQQSILAQMPGKKVARRPKAEEQDDDEEDGSGDPDDDGLLGPDSDPSLEAGNEPDTGAAARPGEAADDEESGERGSWFGRLLKRRGKKNEAPTGDQDMSGETSPSDGNPSDQ